VTKKNILIYILYIVLIRGQEIPNENFLFQKKKMLQDYGENWLNVTTFGPIRFNRLAEYNPGNDSLKIDLRIGLNGNAANRMNGVAFYSYGHLSFQKYFYAYVYPRIVNNPNSFPRYTGKERYFGRTGETDLAGIGYENNWMIMQWGRGRQSWGAGNDIQLAISEDSPSYDYGLIGLDFGHLRVRYFHGFLEEESEYNRYITGRCIEWTNKKSFVIGLSEIVIYSGIDRPLDIAYLNPISTHLEIEMNERQNESGFASGNGVWQAYVDCLLRPNLRLSGNVLFDEFTLDIGHELEEGEGHSNAVSVRAVWSPKVFKKMYTSFFTEYIMVGTHTLRHQSGYNNFIQRGLPLGWQHGSDGDQYRVGLNIFNNTNLITKLSFGSRRLGKETITNDPYEPYPHFQEVPFPSGTVIKTKFITGDLQWWWKPNVSLMAGLEWLDSDKDGQEFSFHIGFDIYYPSSFKL
jgi:hypothetical protein